MNAGGNMASRGERPSGPGDGESPRCGPAAVLAVALAYVATGRLGLLLAIPPGYATPVWVPSGIAVVAALVLGYRVWPGLLLGSMLVNFGTALDLSGPLPAIQSLLVPLGIGAGAALQAVAGASLVRRFVRWPSRLAQCRSILLFSALAGPVACLVNPSLAVLLLLLAGHIPWSRVPFTWWTWWVGDSIGVLVFAPVLLAWALGRVPAWRSRRFAMTLPMAAMFTFAVVLFVRVSAWTDQQIRADFRHRAATLTMRLQQRVEQLRGELISVTRLFASSQHVNGAEFHSFVAPIPAENPDVRCVAWQPFMPPDAEVYREPPQSVPSWYAAHAASEPVVDAIRRSRAEATPAATAPVWLPGPGAPCRGVELIAVVQGGGPDGPGPEGGQRGCVVMDIDVPELLRDVLGEPTRSPLRFTLQDRGVRVAVFGTEHGTDRLRPPDAARLTWRGFVALGGRRWDLTATPDARYLSRQDTWQAWLVMAAALVVVALLEVLLLVITGRTEQIRRTVEERTAQLEEAKRSLEAEVNVRRRTEAELRLRSEEFERSNRDLEQFAYATSHDLQEPLRTITSFIGLLERRYGDSFDDSAREWLEFISNGAVRMSHMIKALLTYSRVGTRAPKLTTVDLGQVLDEVRQDLDCAIRESTAQIVGTNLPELQADPDQMRMLLQNLIGNAIKFRGPAPPVVHIEAVPAEEGCEVIVRDNGIGIDPKQSDRIFEVFQRLHAAADYPGTGIGLALCRRIVERHGGRIWVEPSEQAGAAFHFTVAG